MGAAGSERPSAMPLAGTVPHKPGADVPLPPEEERQEAGESFSNLFQ